MTAERAIFAAVAASGAAMSIAAMGLASRSASISIAAGAAIALVNLWAYRNVVRTLVAATVAAQASVASGVFLGLKQIGLLGFVGILLTRHLVAAGPLALGYAALPIGVAIGAVVCEKPR